MWTIKCNFWNFFPFSKNVDYHMLILKFFPFLLKRGLSYVIFGISLPSPKTWTLICNFWNFFPFSKNLYIICSLWNLFSISKNLGYHMQHSEFFALLLKRGLSYAICEISFYFPKTWTIICNFSIFFSFFKNVDYRMQFLEFISFLQKR